MAKWKSPIFSDIRNKLGENVVFSMWKGRQYMRSYTKPANPKTLAQTANRLHMKALVSYWQTNIATYAGMVKKWNAAGLTDLISGFNRFIKLGRGTVCPTATLAHASMSITLTGVGVPSSSCVVAAVESGTGTVRVSTKRGAGTYTASDFTGYTPASGDKLYIVDLDALGLAAPTSNADCLDFGCYIYKVDESAGTITQCVLT